MEGHHQLYKELSGIVGSKYVADDDFVLFAYSKDMGPMPPKIQGIVVRPGSVEEVVDIVKLANQTLTPIIPSGGRASIYGPPPGAPGRGIVVDMKRMNKITRIDEENLCATAEAGINTCEFQTQLEDKGWTIHTAYQPWYPDTVGGILSGCSGGGGGMRMSSVGFDYHYINSIKVVLGNGDVVESAASGNIGKRVPFAPEVAGPMLTPMFIGDAGAFGIKVDATFRMFRVQGSPRTGEVAYFDREEDAWRCYQNGCLTEPMPSDQWCVMSPYSVRTSLMCPEGWILINCWGGMNEKEIEMKREWFHEIVKKHGGKVSDLPAIKEIVKELVSARKWRELGEFATGGRYYLIEVMSSLRDAPEAFHTIRDIVYKRYKEAGVVTRMSECTAAMGVHSHVSSWIIWYNDTDPKEAKLAVETFKEAFDLCTSRGWAPDLTQGYGSKMMAKYWAPGFFNFMKTMKKALDPNNIMNPGVWGELL